jgi:protein TonB
VAVHLAIIGAVSAASIRGRAANPEKPQAVVIRFTEPIAPSPVMHPSVAAASAARAFAATIPMVRIPVPISVPTTLPPIDLSSKVAADSIVIGGSTRATGGPPRSLVDGEPAAMSNEWRGSELSMHILTTATPRYPESLRSAGINGRVLVRFTVDTVGRVDPASIRILASTHELFTMAVREALARFRFKPAEVGGRRVAALAEMPFEFQITRD